MGGMITHAKLPCDQPRDTFGGPHLAPEPIGFGSLGQQGWQLGTLFWTQFWRCARRWLMAQRFWTLGLATAEPLANGSFSDSQSFRNLVLGPSLFVQFPGAQPSAFAPIFWQRWSCFHTSFPTGYATSERRWGESPEKLAKTAEMCLPERKRVRKEGEEDDRSCRPYPGGPNEHAEHAILVW